MIEDIDEAAKKEDEKKKKKAAAADAAAGGANVGRVAGGRSARLAARAADMTTDEETKKRRDEHQRLLMEKQREAALKRRDRGAGGGDNNGDDVDAELRANPIEAYHSSAELPKGTRACALSVDKAHDAVLVPLFGTLVPFHISTIKSVTKTEEGPKSFLRLNFYAPNQALGKDVHPAMAAAVARNGASIFVKTLNFMSRDGRNLASVEAQIKALQKKDRAEREAHKQAANLVEQARLILSKDRVPRLSDLSMWPPLSGRKTVGTIEAHTNGLRFVSNKGEKVELTYANVRHAIFQPCEAEHIVLLHFHLKHAIMIGKKKVRSRLVLMWARASSVCGSALPYAT